MAGRGVIDRGRRNVIGVGVNVIDLEAATEKVLEAAEKRAPFGVTAAASHAVMMGHADPELRWRLNALEMIVPDGQPVRHALRLVHGERLPGPVTGSALTLAVCTGAAERGLPVYFYGSTDTVLTALRDRLTQQIPGLAIAGTEPSRFRPLSVGERDEVVSRIDASGARVVFVGLGCPRQEVWAYEMRERLSIPQLAVGAAFDFHAGLLARAPRWMQDRSLEWLYRLSREPTRLWRRYLGLGPRFIGLVIAQKLRLRRFDDPGREPAQELRIG